MVTPFETLAMALSNYKLLDVGMIHETLRKHQYFIEFGELPLRNKMTRRSVQKALRRLRCL